MTSETIVTSAMLDLVRAAKNADVTWALIGGQALIAYGVPRETLDADALVPSEAFEKLAATLVETFGWKPLSFDEESNDYVESNEIVIHFMDDPVLFDLGVERRMIPLKTPLGLPVELLDAQHPVEQEMVSESLPKKHHGVLVPVAPLGGVLLVKTKADRKKDLAAIEQTAEHLPSATIDGAIAWAKRHDPATAEDLRSLLSVTRARRTPSRTKPYVRKRRT